jgi:PAP2 superfamily
MRRRMSSNANHTQAAARKGENMFARRLAARFLPLVLALSLGLAGQVAGASTAGAAAPPPSGTTAIVAWNKIALNSVVTVANQSPAAAIVSIGFVQAAVYDAVVAIQGGYQPYHYSLAPRHPDASVEAAVTAAAHDLLAHYFPTQQATFDALLATSLAAVPDGPAKTDGIAIGQASAASLIAFRQGDGLLANIGFTMPAPAIGVFQLPAGQVPGAPWLSKFRPFMLQSPDRFRPGPPPALTSPVYAASFNESKYFGGTNSPYRTPEQSDVALFSTSAPIPQFNNMYQSVIASYNLTAVQATRLLAMTNLVGADALVACWDAKYTYLAWRPQFAIPQGDLDGNPFTRDDPTWTPLAPTPSHPEYPSAHGCGSEAQTYALVSFLGTPNINVDITGNAPGLVHATRHYQTASQLINEIGNARVWGGMHFRFSLNPGVRLGQHVAIWTLQRYFQRLY